MIIQKKIEDKLGSFFNPQDRIGDSFVVLNESFRHSVPKGSETHFRVEVVSSIFEGKRLLERHRMLNSLLEEELSQIKACSLHTFTPQEWEDREHQANPSPTCAGSKK